MLKNWLLLHASRSPGDTPGRASAPPLRQEYGGPRHASDGSQVSPDGSEPERSVDAPPTPHQESPAGKTPPLPVPPTVPPSEPQPVPVDDPPLPPDVPYTVRKDHNADEDR